MNKKIVRILFLFLALFLVFILKSNVKAMTINCNDVDYTIPGFPESSGNFDVNSIVIFAHQNGSVVDYDLFTFPGFDANTMRFVHPNASHGMYSFGVVGLSDCKVFSGSDAPVRAYRWFCDSSCDTWSLSETYDSTQIFYSNGFFSTDSIVYSSIDIYNLDHWVSGGYYFPGDTIVFPRVAPPSNLVLTPIVEKQAGEMEKVPKEIILILPMILVVVASYIGLRKALTMLSQILHRA